MGVNIREGERMDRWWWYSTWCLQRPENRNLTTGEAIHCRLTDTISIVIVSLRGGGRCHRPYYGTYRFNPVCSPIQIVIRIRRGTKHPHSTHPSIALKAQKTKRDVATKRCIPLPSSILRILTKGIFGDPDGSVVSDLRVHVLPISVKNKAARELWSIVGTVFKIYPMGFRQKMQIRAIKLLSRILGFKTFEDQETVLKTFPIFFK